jgi:hypothetical protein
MHPTDKQHTYKLTQSACKEHVPTSMRAHTLFYEHMSVQRYACNNGGYACSACMGPRQLQA